MTALPLRTGWGEARHVPTSHGATRLERLERLHLIAKDSELSALPCTEERALRRQRADRIALALMEERVGAATEPCSVCGQPARPETGLCGRCQESYDAEMDSSRAWWLGEGL